MKKFLILTFAVTLSFFFYACGDQHSKQYKMMEEEVLSVENQINEASDCDNLQVLNFGIMGLRSDFDNFKMDAELTDTEVELLEDMLGRIEAAWYGKWAALDCDHSFIENEMDTSGESDEWAL